MCSSMYSTCCPVLYLYFFFNDAPTTEIYTLSLHDALPISKSLGEADHGRTFSHANGVRSKRWKQTVSQSPDRKSTRLNSSHTVISYAVFCLKKKKKN